MNLDFIRDLEGAELQNAIKNRVSQALKNELLRSDEAGKIEICANIFNYVATELEANFKLSPTSASVLLGAINEALTQQSESYLYKLIYEKDRLDQQINAQKQEIRRLNKESSRAIEGRVLSSSFAAKDAIAAAINNAFLENSMLLNILKETAESAFLAAIEAASDVSAESEEIAKRLLYMAILESGFAKGSFISTAKAVLEAAINIANESKNYSKELISGAILGTHEGLLKAASRFKDDLRFVPDEVLDAAEATIKDISRSNDDFTALLRALSASVDNPAKGVIMEILQSEFDSYIARAKNICLEASELLKERLAPALNSEKLIQAKTEAKRLGERLYASAKQLLEATKNRS